jgi:DNA polymerase III epsilon subunit-like protein
MKKYLFFDTETTGLPKSWNAHVHDLDNWPRMIQLAFSHYDEAGNKLSEHCYIITPDGFEIPKEASDINRVTTERAKIEGVSLGYALDMFSLALSQSDALIAHNISFDKAIMGSEFIRRGTPYMYEKIIEIEKICTMHSTTNFCQLSGPRGYKWPKLQELHFKLFGENFAEAHDALVDVNAMVKCFFKLKELNIL